LNLSMNNSNNQIILNLLEYILIVDSRIHI
jgi:hypothetical protein